MKWMHLQSSGRPDIRCGGRQCVLSSNQLYPHWPTCTPKKFFAWHWQQLWRLNSAIPQNISLQTLQATTDSCNGEDAVDKRAVVMYVCVHCTLVAVERCCVSVCTLTVVADVIFSEQQNYFSSNNQFVDHLTVFKHEHSGSTNCTKANVNWKRSSSNPDRDPYPDVCSFYQSVVDSLPSQHQSFRHVS